MRKSIAIGLALVALTCCGRGYSEGERSGTVYKLSYKGVVYKSWEGIMHLGTAAPGQSGTMTPDDWSFSIVDPVVAKQVQIANERGDRVSLHYTQWMQSPCSMSTDYEVVGVTVAGK